MADKDASPETLSTGDDEFEPTVEMMMDDFDDEQTIEDEELQDDADGAEELALLEEEGDMPLEQLMALYGYDDGVKSQQKGQKSEEEEGLEDAPTASAAKKEDPEIKISEKRKRDYDDYVSESAGSGTGSESRELVNIYGQTNNDSDVSDESDSDYEPLEWKKEIRIGPEYQAKIPECTLKSDKKNCNAVSGDTLLWTPDNMNEDNVVNYLSKYCQPSQDAVGLGALPTGNDNKDDDKALYILLQNNFDADKAISHREHFTGEYLNDSTPLWSEDECCKFEDGLKLCGKNFYQIRQSLLPMRSVGEIVQFYYLWKKTERYDAFTMQLNNGKRKGYFQPGVTDYMDRFLDENEVDVHLNPYERAQPLNSADPLNNDVIAGGSASSRFPVGLRVPSTYKPDNFASDEKIVLTDLYRSDTTENLGKKSSVDDAEDDQGHSIPVKHFNSETTPKPQDSAIQSAN